MNKVIIIILLLITIAGGGYFGYQWWQENNRGPFSNEIPVTWKTYTNPTFGYTIKHPGALITKQAKDLEADVNKNEKDMRIEFYDGNTLMLQIKTDDIAKTGYLSLSSLASEIPAPMDKTTVSDIVTYKIGNLDGYRRLITVSDPASQKLQYVTKDDILIYHLTTFEKDGSADVTKMLWTFKPIPEPR